MPRENLTPRSMLLERRIVDKLENYNILKGHRIKKIDFVGYVSDTIWPRWNYPFCSKGKFAKKIVHILSDCYEEGYIKTDDERLFVTTKGRQFLSFSGYWEEYFKRRKRFSETVKAIVLSSTFSSLLTWFIIHFQSFSNEK